ncbi:hypothetical protein LZ31DRAFT_200843 [Colletotrichum somersetense]|nr:hypothetical protein LZ31DRAFT_200843 [Colletotrichum somersetense]
MLLALLLATCTVMSATAKQDRGPVMFCNVLVPSFSPSASSSACARAFLTTVVSNILVTPPWQSYLPVCSRHVTWRNIIVSVPLLPWTVSRAGPARGLSGWTGEFGRRDWKMWYQHGLTTGGLEIG